MIKQLDARSLENRFGKMAVLWPNSPICGELIL